MKLNEHMYEHMYEQDTKIIRWMAMTKYHRLLKWPTISSGKAFRERLEGYGSPDWLWEVGHGPVATVFPLGDPKNNSENCKGIYSFAFRFLTLRWWSWKTKAKRIKDDQKKRMIRVIKCHQHEGYEWDINGIFEDGSHVGHLCMEVQLHGRFLKPTGKTIWLRRGLGKSVTPSREPEFFMGFVWSWEFLLQIFEPRPAFDLIRCFWFDQMWVPSWCQTMSRRF